LSRDQTLDGDAVRERLLELAGHVAPASERALEHDRSRATAVVGDRRLDLVTHREGGLVGVGIAELGQIDHRLRLRTDGDEGARRSDADHAAPHDVAGADAPSRWHRRALALGEQRREMSAVRHVRGRAAVATPASRGSLTVSDATSRRSALAAVGSRRRTPATGGVESLARQPRASRRRVRRAIAPSWPRIAVEAAAVLAATLVAVIAVLGRLAEWLSGVGPVAFAGVVLGLGIAAPRAL